MNLDRARLLLSRLSIKHRDRNVNVPFILNPNQLKAFQLLRQQYDRDEYVRAIVLKARRVGMSSLMDALLWVHTLAKPQAHALIVAHLKEVSAKGLFRVPRDLAEELNTRVRHPVCDVRATEIRTAHTDGESILDVNTAGSVGGGRGLTLTALHLSEAALYPGQDSFLSMLPAVSKAPNTMIVLESTAQGRTGIGKVFYEHWLAAGRTGRQWNGYVQIFLSWLEDPACVAPEARAKDAPATDLERELMGKPFFATRSQIAWMRIVLEGECQGSEQKFQQEYPHTDSVAFVSTGDPAFTPKELRYAFSTRIADSDFCRCNVSDCSKPHRGAFARSGNRVLFHTDPDGKWRLYERPLRDCYYYVGNDCARGMEAETGRSTGDFTANVVLNGTTGRIAAKYSEWTDPPTIANELDMVGRYYNRAMINPELTGNLGLWCQRELRDTYRYSNLYIWKGKDDKVVKPGARGHSLGWETTSRTRDLMFATFRAKLVAGMKDEPGGLEPRDTELCEQMDLCTMSTGLRWEVERGHDDVLMAAMLAVIACAQYPPPNVLSFKHNVYENPEDRRSQVMAMIKAQPDLARDLARIQHMVKREVEPRRITRAMRMDY